MAPPRPLTRQEWLATSRQSRGNWTYSKYVRWWNNSVRPRLNRRIQQAEINKWNALFKPRNEADMLSQAGREAEASLLPQRAELERLRREQAAFYAQRAKDIQGFGLASAESLKSIGPQIQAGYQGAAGETAAFSKGFADANTQLAAASSQGANELLAQVGPTAGAPAGQSAQITAAAGAGARLGGGTAGAALHDVTYGLGEIGAAGLAREGAAFGAAAGFLPNAALGQANASLRQSGIDAANADKEFSDKLQELEMTRPDLVNKVMASLRDYELQKRATWINQQYLGIKSTSAAGSLAKAKLDIQSKKLDIQKKKIDIQKLQKQLKGLGISPNKVSESLSAGAGHLVDVYGNDILRNGKTVPYHRAYKPSTGTKTGPGSKAQGNIGKGIESIYKTVAKDYVKTTTAVDPNNPGAGAVSRTGPKYTWQQARNMLWSQYGNAIMGNTNASNRAATKRRVESAITQALMAAGYAKPRYSRAELQTLPINRLVQIARQKGYSEKITGQKHDSRYFIDFILQHQGR